MADIFYTTGRLARALGVTEPRLSELVRRGRVSPPPVVVSGRRVWNQMQAEQAAAILGRSKAIVAGAPRR